MEPAATPVATPNELIVAMVVSEDVQFRFDVNFCVLWSLNVPVAV